MDAMVKFDKAAIGRAERLRAIRERLHKIATQRAFAGRLGVSQARYNHWERGWPIPEEQARKIKAITPGVDLDYILEGDENGLSVDALKKLKGEES